MSTITVTAKVDADEILCELSSDELADELADRAATGSQSAKKAAHAAIDRLTEGRGFSEERALQLLEDIETAERRGDRQHFLVLLGRLRELVAPSPAPRPGMLLVEMRL